MTEEEKKEVEVVETSQEAATETVEDITAEVYTIYAEKIRTNAAKLNDISDLYLQLTGLINELYCICRNGGLG